MMGEGLLHLKIRSHTNKWNEVNDMEVLRISSRRNPLIVEAVKLLKDTNYRRQLRKIAAEGKKLFDDALTSGADIDTVIASESLEASLVGVDVNRLIVVPDWLFTSISTHKTPQGLMFFCNRPDEKPQNIDKGNYIVLDGVQDPGNVGTIIRTAAAFNIKGVIICGPSADPFGPKVVRASMGAIFRVPVFTLELGELDKLCKDIGIPLYSAEPTNDSKDIRDLGIEPVAVVIGSEGQGVSREVKELCYGTVSIPMAAGTESLNAAVAASIIMWETAGKRGEK